MCVYVHGGFAIGKQWGGVGWAWGGVRWANNVQVVRVVHKCDATLQDVRLYLRMYVVLR